MNEDHKTLEKSHNLLCPVSIYVLKNGLEFIELVPAADSSHENLPQILQSQGKSTLTTSLAGEENCLSGSWSKVGKNRNMLRLE